MKLLNINGFNVLHMPHPSDLISVRVAVNAGSAHEADKEDYGVAHFLEHMFFKGTKNKGFKELNIQMAKLGDSNAHTSQSSTVYFINTTKPRFAETADLLSEFVFEPAFVEEEFQKERNVILEELQTTLDDPYSYFWYNSFEHVYGDSGHPIIGTKETISNVQLDQLLQFRNKFYGPDNMLFIVSGNLKESQVTKVMEKALQRGEAGQHRSHKRSKVTVDWQNNKNAKFHHSAEQAYMMMFYKGSNLQDRKRFGFAPSVFDHCLGGGLYSVLGMKIREEMGLCYSIWTSRSGFPECKSTIIGTQLKPENIQKAKKTIVKELEKVRQEGFSDELIDTVKSTALYSNTKCAETANGYASMFGDGFLQTRKYAPIEERSVAYTTEQLNKVTNDDLIKYANWVCKDGFKFTYMVPESNSKGRG